jgi:hypothetical protein
MWPASRTATSRAPTTASSSSPLPTTSRPSAPDPRRSASGTRFLGTSSKSSGTRRTPRHLRWATRDEPGTASTRRAQRRPCDDRRPHTHDPTAAPGVARRDVRSCRLSGQGAGADLLRGEAGDRSADVERDRGSNLRSLALDEGRVYNRAQQERTGRGRVLSLDGNRVASTHRTGRGRHDGNAGFDAGRRSGQGRR